MILEYILAFSLAFLIVVLSMPAVKKLAPNVGAVDIPNARKIHKQPIPRIGGVAIFLGFLVPFLLYFDLDRRLWGFLIGLLIIFGIGLFDDIHSLSPWKKLPWQILAGGAVLAGGIGIVSVTDPFTGGLVALDDWRIPMELFGWEFNLLPLANLVSILWIVGLVNTVNFLDGMDGLAAGVCVIASLVLFVIALSPIGDDQGVALMSLILAGALLGFLVYNWHPSSIFMGDSGAYAIGLILAVITIYAGSKIAIGVLVLGVAIFDALWAVMRRLYQKRSPFSPDRGHIHHQLIDSGLTQTQAVSHLYLVAFLIGLAAIFFGGITAFFVLMVMLVITVSMVRLRGRSNGLSTR